MKGVIIRLSTLLAIADALSNSGRYYLFVKIVKEEI
ncbi:hypothetical protein PanABDRAFT_0055 [Pantoea sp. aB]|jgi:hypothetical protein|nr:hypothetical protein PanABDRAFT_0055 [Pantoea sp. aB]